MWSLWFIINSILPTPESLHMMLLVCWTSSLLLSSLTGSGLVHRWRRRWWSSENIWPQHRLWLGGQWDAASVLWIQRDGNAGGCYRAGPKPFILIQGGQFYVCSHDCVGKITPSHAHWTGKEGGQEGGRRRFSHHCGFRCKVILCFCRTAAGTLQKFV